MPRYTEVGRAVKRARLAHQLTQVDTAQLAGLSRGYVGWIERGTRRPTPEVLARIAEAVGADYTELARAAGYAPQSIGEYTVTVDSLEKAAWLRQLAARFGAEELEAAYGLLLQWVPRGVEYDQSTTTREERSETEGRTVRAG